MKPWLKVLFLSTLFTFISISSASALGISPYIIEMKTEAGQDGSQIVKVFNDSNLKFKVKAYAHDVGFDESGNKTHKPVGFFDKSIAKYIEIIPNEFVLGKNETKEVKIILKSQKNWLGGNGAVVLFDAQAAKPKISDIAKENIKASLDFKLSLGAVVLHQVTGTGTTKSKVNDVEIESKKSGRKIDIAIDVENEGNTFIKSSGFISLLDSKDGYIGKVEIPKLVIFPGKKETIKSLWKGRKLNPGTYNALITYEYGEDKTIIMEKSFTVN